MVPPGMVAASKAVRDYDDSLCLGRRDDGEWLVCKERPDGAGRFPVLSLGKSPEAPSREFIMEKLYKGDVRRNASRIVAAVDRANARLQAERRAEASAAAAEWAEYAEFHTRGG